jgi:xanthine dehydrogenase YagS FAD-binding subunit
MEGGEIAEALLALGGVAPNPWRVRAAEQLLAGAAPSEATFRKAAEAALADATPTGDTAVKIDLARRIAVRALTLAAAGTPEHMPALPGSLFSSVSGASHDLCYPIPRGSPPHSPRLQYRPAAHPPRWRA